MRITVARGVYRDLHGYEVRWQDRGERRSKRFPLDTPLDELKAFRKRQIGQSRDRAPRHGSFVRDVVRFLAQRKRRPCFKSDRAHLRPWIARFRFRSRFAVHREDIAAAITEWTEAGYSAREIRHRVKLLAVFYRTIDPGQPTPCDGVALPRIGKHRKIRVSPDTIRDVALALRRQEWPGVSRLRSAKTRARFLILALTGQRPIQLMRAQPMDVDLERRLWFVRPAKGDDGTVVALNEEMVAAWQLFIDAKAWGRYDSRSFSKVLKRNGWPKGIRPYTLRHSVGQTLKDLGVELGTIQDHLGHASPATTAAFYVEPSLAQLRQTSEKLTGRMPTTALLPQSSATSAGERKRKAAAKTEQSRHGRSGARAGLSDAKSKKSA